MNPTICEGSILDAKTDAIVNPANSFLRHSGGLARIIAEAAMGPAAVNPGMDEREWFSQQRRTEVALKWAEEQRGVNVPTGGAHWTSAGVLPFKGIVHAVGPIWGGGHLCEPDLLELAHESAIECALAHGCKSIAFPAISCGIFGYPVDQAAKIAVGVMGWYDPSDIAIEVYPFGFEEQFRTAKDSA